MPPKVKYQKKDIVKAAFKIAQKKGMEYVTAREVAKELGGSVAPIFTCFKNMDELKLDVYNLIKEIYSERIKKGLEAPIPFLGVWKQYMFFAKEEPMLYRTLFFSRPENSYGGVMDILRYTQSIVRPSIMRIYHMDAHCADRYFMNIWLMAIGFSALKISDNNLELNDAFIVQLGTELSLAICKAYKEIPGLPYGDYDKDKIFSELVKM